MKLSDDERASFAGQLERVLGYAERIQAIDTEGLDPKSHATESEESSVSVLRDDEPRPSLDREKVLEGAPDAGSGLFRVPKVLP